MDSVNPKTYKVIKEQFLKDLNALEELSMELGLFLTGEELLRYSALVVGSYAVKKKYHYYKLMGVLTGEETDRVEVWYVRKTWDTEERVRTFRRERVHLLNVKANEENSMKLTSLITFWRRCKALKRWLELVDGKQIFSIRRE